MNLRTSTVSFFSLMEKILIVRINTNANVKVTSVPSEKDKYFHL